MSARASTAGSGLRVEIANSNASNYNTHTRGINNNIPNNSNSNSNSRSNLMTPNSSNLNTNLNTNLSSNNLNSNSLKGTSLALRSERARTVFLSYCKQASATLESVTALKKHFLNKGYSVIEHDVSYLYNCILFFFVYLSIFVT